MQQQQAGGPPEQPPRPNAMPVLLEGAAGGFAQQSQGVPWPAIPTPEDLEFYSRGKQRRKLYRDLKLLGSGAEGWWTKESTDYPPRCLDGRLISDT